MHKGRCHPNNKGCTAGLHSCRQTARLEDRANHNHNHNHNRHVVTDNNDPCVNHNRHVVTDN
ncbi:MAG: hypothetical protein ACKOQ1_06410, partial [Actinomycetota bacterium]